MPVCVGHSHSLFRDISRWTIVSRVGLDCSAEDYCTDEFVLSFLARRFTALRNCSGGTRGPQVGLLLYDR